MVLPLVRPSGIVRDFLEASDTLNIQHIDRSAAGDMYIGAVNTAGQKIYLGTATTTIEIAGTLTLLDSSTLIANSGSISLGDGDGDVITLGGGGAGDTVNIGSTSADTINVNSYTDNVIQGGSIYYYRVCAKSNFGESDLTNQVSIDLSSNATDTSDSSDTSDT